MGEIVEDMLDGIFCMLCGIILDGDAHGYPRWCWECRADATNPSSVVKKAETKRLKRWRAKDD